MPKKKTMWECSDGTIKPSKQQADIHEETLALKTAMSAHPIRGGYEGCRVELGDVLEWAHRHSDTARLLVKELNRRLGGVL